ncbi:MAG: zinc ribbon domain-containing protein [Candidatus Bathyarchaeia archaeon]|jgi:hypothetical protein
MAVSKSRELGTGIAVGLIAGGVLATLLSIFNFPFSAPVGAFVSGALAAYVIYDKVGLATLGGACAGLLSLPFYLGLSQIFVIFEIIPIPPGPQPTMAELQSAVVAITLMDIVAGAVAGSILGAIHHPPPPSVATPLPTYPAEQSKYCVQCGAKMTPGTLICPHCGARQPEMARALNMQ